MGLHVVLIENRLPRLILPRRGGGGGRATLRIFALPSKMSISGGAYRLQIFTTSFF